MKKFPWMALMARIVVMGTLKSPEVSNLGHNRIKSYVTISALIFMIPADLILQGDAAV
jgi:hypothetical protein